MVESTLPSPAAAPTPDTVAAKLREIEERISEDRSELRRLARRATSGVVPELVSISQARELLGSVSRDTIYRLLANGRLQSVHIGRRRMIVLYSVLALVRASLSSPSM